MKNIITIFMVCFVTLATHAQLLPSRNMFPDLRADSARASGFLTRTKFFGEMMRGFNSAGDDRAWDATIGGFADVYTWNSFTSIRVRFAQDMLANSLTHDIHFKPRSMQYEENISGVFHTPGFDWEAGLTYRCKHDIDNTDDPSSSVTPPVDSATQKRVIILGGVYALEEGRIGSLLQLLGYDSKLFPVDVCFRLDAYPIHEDNRFPANTVGILWSNVLGSLTYNIHIDIVSLSWTTAYMDVDGTQFYWKGMKFNSQGGDDERLETGLHFTGAVSGIDAFVSYEHLFDDLSIPEPRASNTVSVGLRVN